MGHVSIFTQFAFILLIAVGTIVPLSLLLYGTRKLKAKESYYYIGCAVFLISSYIISNLINNVIIRGLGSEFTDSIYMNAFYRAISVFVFEEVVRFVVFKMYFKDNIQIEGAVMYGFGHGSVEAIMACAAVGFDRFIMTKMINNGTAMEALMKPEVTEAEREQTIASLSTLWNTNSLVFFEYTLKGLCAIAIQVAITVLVYKGIKEAKNNLVAAGIFAHFVIIFVYELAAKAVSPLAADLIFDFACVAVCYFAYTVCKDEIPGMKQRQMIK